MDKRTWQLLKSLYDKAIQLDKSEIEAFLDSQKKLTPSQISILRNMLETEDEQSSLESANITNIISKTAEEAFSSEFALQPGQRIEKFTVEKNIGDGGMGSVYLAHREGGDFTQRVAIKVIHKRHTTASSIERFKRERQILASLNHPNIASFISGGETPQGSPYIILEYVEGTSITSYCQQNQLSIDERLSLFLEVSNAIKYAHQNLVVHRDIKPNNVLVTKEGAVKLLDFGIAKLLQDDGVESGTFSDITQEHVRVLTPSSASPEQVTGQSVTTRSDVYGLGTLLMHMLTDEPVFDTTRRSSREIETMIIEQAPEKPSVKCALSDKPEIAARSRILKGDIDTIVLHMLQKDPLRRYSTVEQIEDDIKRFQSNYPILAQPDSLLYRTKKFIQRNTLTSFLSAGLLVSLVLFSIVVSRQAILIERERDAALEQASLAEETANFMTDLFTAARVDQSNGEEVSAADVLEQALLRIEELQTTQSVKSILLLSLAQVQTTLDNFDESIELLQNARNLLDQNPFENPETQAVYDIKIDVEYADTILLQGDYKDAISRFEEILKRLDGYAEESLITGETLLFRYRATEYAIGNAYYYVGDNEMSARHLKKAIEYAELIESESVPPIFHISYGGALRSLGQLQESKSALEKSIVLERESDEPASLDLAYALNQLAATLELLGEIDTAITIAKEGLEIREKMLGLAHIESISSAGMLSNLHVANRNFDEAIKIRNRVLRAMEEEEKTAHPYYAITLGSVSNIYKRNGQLDNAKTGLIKAHQLLEQFFTDGHFEVSRPLLILSEIALLQGDIRSARKFLAKANEILKVELNEDHQLTGLAYGLQSVILRFDQKTTEAENAEKEAYRIFEKLYERDSERFRNFIEMIEKTTSSVLSSNVNSET